MNPRRFGQGPCCKGNRSGRGEAGVLKPGGVIVEGTAGNTGIGLALVETPVVTGP